MRRIFTAAFCFVTVLASALAPAGQQSDVVVIDTFESIEAWRVVTPEGVEASVSRDFGPNGACLRLDYRFVTGGGYCIVQRDVPRDLPENYAFGFLVRGESPNNNLEFKLLDESGESVWWVNKRAFEFPAEWKRIEYRRRHFSFAWGPLAGKPLTRLGMLEFAVASNEGGAGTVWLDELTFRELPAPTEGPIKLEASVPQESAVDGDLSTHTVIVPNNTMTLQLDGSREVGAVVVRWGAPLDPTQLSVTVSDGDVSSRKFTATAVGEETRIWLGECAADTITLAHDALVSLPVAEVSVLSGAEAGPANGFIAAAAKDAPRGRYPRWALNEQVYWTVVGVPGGVHEALLSEDGAVEIGKRGFTIEPFLDVGGQMMTWADGERSHALADGSLPLPEYSVAFDGATLAVRPHAQAISGSEQVVVAYEVTNTGDRPLVGDLVLLVRPYQVNPPWQNLNFDGGFSPIRTAWQTGDSIVVNNDFRLRFPGFTPESHRFGVFPAGVDPIAAIERGDQASLRMGGDPAGMLTAAAHIAIRLEPGSSQTITLAANLTPGGEAMQPLETITDRADVIEEWRNLTGAVTLDLPPSAKPIADTYRAQLGYILVNRDGPAIQPGSRSYERSWARDGSMTSAALLEAGIREPVRAWVEWFAAHQFESGKVPCVVDTRGPDPVPEHDSHGQLIFAIANDYRATGDKDFLRRHWSNVVKAVDYIQEIRATRMTPEYAEPGSPLHAFFGLVPESISHEGYSAKPMHSYWDDLFVLKGLKDAVYIAGELGETEAAERYSEITDEFRSCLVNSILLATKQHDIDYIPGCVELGDFDSTSTTIAFFPCGEAENLPQGLLKNTFDKYWAFFEKRRDTGEWEGYTPYEVRHIGAFVRMGQRDRALEALDWFMTHQRPAGWRHWAEVVWNEASTPKFIGDMPHTWVGSDYLNAINAMFAYEDEADDSLVLLAGVPQAWLAERAEGLSIRGLHTRWGQVGITARMEDGAEIFEVAGMKETPPGGVRVWAAADRPIRAAFINDEPAEHTTEAVMVRTLPARVRIEY